MGISKPFREQFFEISRKKIATPKYMVSKNSLFCINIERADASLFCFIFILPHHQTLRANIKNYRGIISYRYECRLELTVV